MNETVKDIILSKIIVNQSPDGDFTYIYRGELEPLAMDYILMLTEKNFNEREKNSQTFKKVYFILVELLQNVTKYQEKDNQLLSNSIVRVQRTNKDYFLTVGNLISNAEKENLTERINKINALDQEQLLEFYKSVLLNGKYNAQGGAGLGLINIKRKAKHNLNFSFSTLDDQFSYFYFTSIIPENDQKEIPFSFETVKYTHKLLEKEQIALLYNSHFTQDKLKGLLSFLESKIQNSYYIQKKSINILIEMLQNIIYHSTKDSEKEKFGIFLLSETQNQYKFVAGNYIENHKQAHLLETIEKVNNYTLDDLENVYLKELKAELQKNQSNLGMIDIRWKSNNFLDYRFEKINEQFSFFILEANLDKV